MKIFFFISLVIPRPSRSGIHWPINFFNKSDDAVYFQQQQKMQNWKWREGSFQLFKLSKLCYHFLSSFENGNIFFDISSNPLPIAVQNLLTNNFFQKKMTILFIFNKKNAKLKRRDGSFQLFKLSKLCYYFLLGF